MKLLAALLLFATALSAADKYEVCGLVTASGEVVCSDPQPKEAAALRALVYNALSHGQFIAWVQRIPKGSHKSKPHKGTQPQPPAEEDNSVPANPTGGKPAGISTTQQAL